MQLTHNISQWPTVGKQLQVWVVNPGKNKDVPSRTETKPSHKNRVCLTCQTSLLPGKMFQLRSAERTRVPTPGCAHTHRNASSQWEPGPMAALPCFVMGLKDSALEKTSSRRKKEFWLAAAFRLLIFPKLQDERTRELWLRFYNKLAFALQVCFII